MRVYETHLVKESSGDSDHHVVNVRNDGTDTCELPTLNEPKVDTNMLFSNNLEVHVNVLEVTGKDSTGTGYSYMACLDDNGD